jgi:flagellar basal body-associated protein FliL
VNEELSDLTLSGLPPTEPDPTEPAPIEPEPPKRKRARWYHVVVLGVAVLVCAAAVGFFVSQSSDRDDAAAKRTDAQDRLADQRGDTDAANARLESERTDMQAGLAKVEAITTSLHEFSDLASQHVDDVAAAQAVALRLPDSVDEFNAAIDRANASLTQIHAKSDAILQQVEAFRDETEAQYAAAVSKR